MLEAWINSAQNSEIAKFELEAVQSLQTGKGKSYRRHPIVQQFLDGSELTAPSVGKGCASTWPAPVASRPKSVAEG
jgi:hypothetical protein